MTHGAPIRRSPDVAFRRLDSGEAVLLHVESGSYHGLNATGALLWELIDGTRSRDDVCAELRNRTTDAPPDVEGVVDGFLEALRSRNLISA